MVMRWLLLCVFVGALLAPVLVAGALAVAGSGLIPITASGGHFAITEWFLQFSKRRSVATHTLGLELPSLDDPTLVLAGAGHYESGCRPCHGSPEHRTPVVPHGMLPPPPYLSELISTWEPEHLFYIVKHGIKFTGMPAWPAERRDDEVRAVVAFLLALPGLDVAAYRQLVHGAQVEPAASPPPAELEGVDPQPTAAKTCARCHGDRGHGRELGAFPRLAGQRAEYLYGALLAYARGERPSGIMQPIAAALREPEMRELARFFSSAPGARRGAADAQLAPPDAEAIARGRELATRGEPDHGVPSCADCHGPEPSRQNEAYPRLAGQHAEYLAAQLELFGQRVRGGSEYAQLMHKVAPRMTTRQRRDVAAYYASLARE